VTPLISENEAKNRAGGFFYMGNTTKNDKKLTNGAILIVSKVLKHVMSSAAEAELGAVFINARKLIIPLLQGTAMVQSNKNAQKPWTCAFIGSRIG
jgi:hypothetical protein